MKLKGCIFTYLPICVSFVLLPILTIIGGPDLGVDGTGNKAIDTYVTIFFVLILLGVAVSVFYIPFLLLLGKIREALNLLVCILSFLVYFVLLTNVAECFRHFS